MTGRSTRIAATLLMAVALCGLIAYVAGTASISSAPPVSPASSVEVSLDEEGFVPREVTIASGTTVIFTTTRGKPFWPASNLHPQHDIYPEFDPGRALAPDERWSFTFAGAGTYGFHDHLRAYFNGVIHVIP